MTSLSLVPPPSQIVERARVVPPTPAQIETHWDRVHDLMAGLNESMQTQLGLLDEMAGAVRAQHDTDHVGVSWSVCSAAACRLAAPYVR